MLSEVSPARAGRTKSKHVALGRIFSSREMLRYAPLVSPCLPAEASAQAGVARPSLDTILLRKITRDDTVGRIEGR